MSPLSSSKYSSQHHGMFPVIRPISPLDDLRKYPRIPESIHPLHIDYYNFLEKDRDYGSSRAPSNGLDIPQYTPYLCLPARLSQIWINRWTVLLFLIFIRLALFTSSLSKDLETAEREMQSACLASETGAGALASMPHYMAKGVNKLTADTLDKAVAALTLTLSLILTATESVILFFINMYKQTYICLLNLLIRGSVEVVANATLAIAEFVNSTLNVIEQNIESDISTINDGLNGISDAIKKVASILGQNIALPTVQIPAADALKHFKIPDSFATDLENLTNKISLNHVQELAEEAVKFPFEQVKGLVNSSLGQFRFDESLLMVPDREYVTFCSNNSKVKHFFSDLFATIKTTYKILTLLVLTFAFLAIIPVAIQEWWAWRRLKSRASRFLTVLQMSNTHDPIDLVMMAASPLSAWLSLKLSNRFKKPHSRVMARWFMSYISTTRALVLLAIALAGLLACFLQYIVLSKLRAAAPEVSRDIGDAQLIVMQKIQNASTAWAQHTNMLINTTENNINAEVFGTLPLHIEKTQKKGWINTATSAVNNTLDVFMDTLKSTLRATFNGTPLFQANELDVFRCLIFGKVQTIQSGLTWIHNHAHVTLPTLPNNTFTIQPQSNDILASSAHETTIQFEKVLFQLSDKWASSIRIEALYATAILSLYLLLVLFGLIRVFLAGNSRNRNDGMRSFLLTPSVDSHMGDHQKNAVLSQQEKCLRYKAGSPPTRAAVATPLSAYFNDDDDDHCSLNRIPRPNSELRLQHTLAQRPVVVERLDSIKSVDVKIGKKTTHLFRDRPLYISLSGSSLETPKPSTETRLYAMRAVIRWFACLIFLVGAFLAIIHGTLHANIAAQIRSLKDVESRSKTKELSVDPVPTLPQLPVRCKVYTYFDHKAADMSSEKLLLTIWKRAWSHFGLRPIVLNIDDAKKNTRYNSLAADLREDPSYLHWLAVSQAGGSLLMDYRVFPMADPLDLTFDYLRSCQFSSLVRYSALDAALFHGSPESISALVMNITSENFTSTKAHKDFQDPILRHASSSFKITHPPPGLAYYSPSTVKHLYPNLNNNELPGLVNSHLHQEFLRIHQKGISIIDPFPPRYHSDLFNLPSERLAQRISKCPKTESHLNCIPNTPACTPCKDIHYSFHHSFGASMDGVFFLVNLPHPLISTAIILEETASSITPNQLVKYSDRNEWIKFITKDVFHKSHKSITEKVKYLEDIAVQNKRSIWSVWDQGFVDIESELGFELQTLDVGGYSDDVLDLGDSIQLREQAKQYMLGNAEALESGGSFEIAEAWHPYHTKFFRFVSAWQKKVRLERKEHPDLRSTDL
ncbi:Plasma membrane fusion protein prm1 [Neolecta irregularis DAH-3]|uniref:Plasma membrane fusion protein PRM1 n=1 Tax=Neolecta irregularis (strain DAH-3) TaxID=1198029 RepID=A0A1U7LHX6_NEOID|nr:Plasma membrane fusion protein prm1 [Neolecta irregularis DAH-3]|eukprot:OLL22152.1 Plasma membrane fusion protein prm1 [Neolecta irregularis DAH-3]